MRKFLAISLVLGSLPVLAGDVRTPQEVSGPLQWLPTSANSPGRFGALFKTHLSLLNPTSSEFHVRVKLHDSAGAGHSAVIDLAPGEMKTWDDFLGVVFPGSTAGALEFDSWTGLPDGSALNDFVLGADVYTDEPGGRYKTPLPVMKEILGPTPGYTAGIEIDDLHRTNLGCVNYSSSAATAVQADVLTSDGSLVTTVSIPLVPAGWKQVSLTSPVTHGYIRWTTSGYVYCYAIVVENSSNDGSLIPVTVMP